MNMEDNNISQSRRKEPFSGEKGLIIRQSRFTLVLLQVAFYVKVRLCRSQYLQELIPRNVFTLTECKTLIGSERVPVQKDQAIDHHYKLLSYDGNNSSIFSC